MARKHLAVAVAATAVALAATTAGAQMAAGALPWYGGAAVGAGRTSIDTGAIANAALASGFRTASASGVDENGVVAKFFGGWQPHRNFAVELSLATLGNEAGFDIKTTQPTSSASGDFEAWGAGLDAVGLWPINDRWAVFGKVGAFFYESKTTLRTAPGGLSLVDTKKKTGVGPKYGAGVQYSVDPKLYFRLEYEYYDRIEMGNSPGKNAVGTGFLGVGMRF